MADSPTFWFIFHVVFVVSASLIFFPASGATLGHAALSIVIYLSSLGITLGLVVIANLDGTDDGNRNEEDNKEEIRQDAENE
jgi:hypothetical protein